MFDAIADEMKAFFKGLGKNADVVPEGGMWGDVDPNMQMFRVRDRMVMGSAADASGNFAGNQSALIPNGAYGAAWAIRDSTLCVGAQGGLMAVTGICKTSLDTAMTNQPTEGIASTGILINDKAGAYGWAGYYDIQHEAGAAWSAVEYAVKNKGPNLTTLPYSTALAGANGLWMAGGGDATYGGAPTNPSNAVMTILANAATWNMGFVFMAGALSMVGGFGTAMAMPVNVQLAWYRPDGLIGGRITSQATNTQQRLIFSDYGFVIAGPNGETIANLTHIAGATNYVILQNAPGAPLIGSWGPAADVDLKVQPKGAGVIRYGLVQPITTETGIVGWIPWKDKNGVACKLAVIGP